MSEWSHQMLKGAERARLATAIMIGSRMGAATYTTSFIKARPWLAVAVKVRAPAAAEPRQALIAECSDSTGMYSASSSPLATSSARRSEEHTSELQSRLHLVC